ncbi:MAG TPA: valine--tRNA ligase, partial [Clostridiales bacterium]|nr:valine--tRNA ligase [Clostridiales bacterium]
LGWPAATADLGYFFPTSLLVTGYDIIFFWVARMVFMSLEFTGKLPFDRVLIHGLVRDAQGRKMSKSKGTGVDPLEAVDRYGADALRFGLLAGNAPGNDVRFHWDRVEHGRNFANKLWNAARFTLMNSGDLDDPVMEAPVELPDRWILARLRRAIEEADRLLGRLDLGEAARRLEDFTWTELCDWYIELVKVRLHGQDPGARRRAQLTLRRTLTATLQLLHPFLPFATEAIWQHWPARTGLLCRTLWPRAGDYPADAEAERTMVPIMEVIRAIRTIRSEFNVPPASRATAWLVVADDQVARALEAGRDHLVQLAGLEGLTMVREAISPPKGSATAITAGAQIHVPLRELIDLDREADRIRRQLASITREVERSRQKLADPQFLNRAPAEVVAKEREREQESAVRSEKLERYLRTLG